jgi:tripartite-type tricarboxylate transporter receptor subunit TctC
MDPTTPYAWNDFTYLGLHEMTPFVFAVRADSPFQTLRQLNDALRARPGTLTYGAAGATTLQNLGPQMLLDLLGLPLNAATMVPFQGGAEAVAAAIGGHIDFVGNNLSEIINQVRNRQMRALVVTTPERVPQMADVPTARELGLPELEQLAAGVHSSVLRTCQPR